MDISTKGDLYTCIPCANLPILFLLLFLFRRRCQELNLDDIPIEDPPYSDRNKKLSGEEYDDDDDGDDEEEEEDSTTSEEEDYEQDEYYEDTEDSVEEVVKDKEEEEKEEGSMLMDMLEEINSKKAEKIKEKAKKEKEKEKITTLKYDIFMAFFLP